MTTVYDVARVAGVSTATVSRVIRGSTLVTADTRDRVLAVIDALGFVPDAYAQGLLPTMLNLQPCPRSCSLRMEGLTT